MKNLKSYRRITRIQGERDKVIRRSITVDDENNTYINQLRAGLLANQALEVDFTRAVNMLIALAKYRISNEELSEEELNILRKYAFGSQELELAAVNDEG